MVTLEGIGAPKAPTEIERGDRSVSFIWKLDDNSSAVLACRHQRPANRGLRNGMYVATLAKVSRLPWRAGREGPRIPVEDDPGILILSEPCARYNPRTLEEFSIDAYAVLLEMVISRPDVASIIMPSGVVVNLSGHRRFRESRAKEPAIK